MKVDLPVAKALKLLREAVDERGRDYVYARPSIAARPGPRCLYAHGTEPGCLVGQVLFKAGVTLTELAWFDSIGSITTLYDNGEVEVPEDTLAVLAVAQQEQDFGHSWGEALEAAQAHARARRA